MQALWDMMQRFVFDPSFIDIIVWFPRMTWPEVLTSTATVLAWRFATNKLEGFAAYHARRVLAWGLLRIALFVRP